MRRPPVVTLLTDFGTRDPWVAPVRGVLLCAAAPARAWNVARHSEVRLTSDPPATIETGRGGAR